MQSSTLRSFGCALAVSIVLVARFATARACPAAHEDQLAQNIEVVLADDAVRESLMTPAPSSGTEGTPPFLFAAFMLLMITLPIGAAAVRGSHQRMRRARPESLSLLHAEDALRLVLRGHRLGAFVTGIMTVGGVALVEARPMSAEWLVLVLPAIAFAVFVAQMLFDHGALHYLARAGATAQRRGSWLIVGGTNGDLGIRLSPSIFESARAASVPAASAGLRRGD